MPIWIAPRMPWPAGAGEDEKAGGRQDHRLDDDHPLRRAHEKADAEHRGHGQHGEQLGARRDGAMLFPIADQRPEQRVGQQPIMQAGA